VVNVFALRAVDLDSLHLGNIRQPHRQNRLPVAENPGTAPKIPSLVFLPLHKRKEKEKEKEKKRKEKKEKR